MVISIGCRYDYDVSSKVEGDPNHTGADSFWYDTVDFSHLSGGSISHESHGSHEPYESKPIGMIRKSGRHAGEFLTYSIGAGLIAGFCSLLGTGAGACVGAGVDSVMKNYTESATEIGAELGFWLTFASVFGLVLYKLYRDE